jgi:hypothetical protein
MPCSNCCRAKSYDKTKQAKKDKCPTSTAESSKAANKKCKHETPIDSKAAVKKITEQPIASKLTNDKNDTKNKVAEESDSGKKLENVSKPKKKSSKLFTFCYF